MKLNWDSLLEPIFLFILALIAGTLWVIVPTDPKHEAAIQSTPPVSMESDHPTNVKTAALEKELSTAAQALKTDQDRSQLTTGELQQLQIDNQKLSASIDQGQQSLEKLNAQARLLEQYQKDTQARVGNTAAHNQAIATEMEALLRLAKEREAEAGRLQSDIATIQPNSDVSMPYVPMAAKPTKLPILVELIRNRAVPLTKANFHFQHKLFGPTVAARITQGDSITEMAHPDSSFSKLLKTIDPHKQYLSCLMNADSFEVFREARRLAHQSGIDVGWEPSDTSSGTILIYPVHFTTKAPAKDSKLPRVTPILN